MQYDDATLLLGISAVAAMLWGLLVAHRDWLSPKSYDVIRTAAAISLLVTVPRLLAVPARYVSYLTQDLHAPHGLPTYFSSTVAVMLATAVGLSVSWWALREADEVDEGADSDEDSDDDVGPLITLPPLPKPPARPVAANAAIAIGLALAVVGRVLSALPIELFGFLKTSPGAVTASALVGLTLGAAVVATSLVEEDGVPVTHGIAGLGLVALAVVAVSFREVDYPPSLLDDIVAGLALGLLVPFALRLAGLAIREAAGHVTVVASGVFVLVYVATSFFAGRGTPRPDLRYYEPRELQEQFEDTSPPCSDDNGSILINGVPAPPCPSATPVYPGG